MKPDDHVPVLPCQQYVPLVLENMESSHVPDVLDEDLLVQQSSDIQAVATNPPYLVLFLVVGGAVGFFNAFSTQVLFALLLPLLVLVFWFRLYFEIYWFYLSTSILPSWQR